MSIELLLDSFVRHGYWILFGAILLDNAGLPLPGELFLMTFGALARMGQVDPVSGLLVAWLAALIGDSIGYWMGRLGGHGLLKLYCRLTLGSGDCMENALDFYRRRGPAAVILGRFIVGVRGFLFPLAGSARMRYSRFLFFDGMGALTWAAAFLFTGYSVGWRLQGFLLRYRAASRILAAALGAALLVSLFTKLYRRRRHGPGRLRQETEPQAAEPPDSPAAPAGGVSCRPVEGEQFLPPERPCELHCNDLNSASGLAISSLLLSRNPARDELDRSKV